MTSVNAAVLYLSGSVMGTIFLDPMASETTELVNELQINFLQPIYTFTFSNGLIACLVFMGIGVITDIGYMLISPFRSMCIALFAELGTLLTFPLAVAVGFTFKEAAAVAMIGSADGPMVLYTSRIRRRSVRADHDRRRFFQPTYAGYPYLPVHGPEGAARIRWTEADSDVSAAERSLGDHHRSCACCCRWRRRCSCPSSASSSARPAKPFVDFIGGRTVRFRYLGLLLGVLRGRRSESRRPAGSVRHPRPAAVRHRHHWRLRGLAGERPHLQPGDRYRGHLHSDHGQVAQAESARPQVRRDPAAWRWARASAASSSSTSRCCAERQPSISERGDDEFH